MVNKKLLTYNVQGLLSGSKQDSVSLELKFASKTSNYLIHRALTHELINNRQYTASTKTKSEVRGGLENILFASNSFLMKPDLRGS